MGIAGFLLACHQWIQIAVDEWGGMSFAVGGGIGSPSARREFVPCLPSIFLSQRLFKILNQVLTVFNSYGNPQ